MSEESVELVRRYDEVFSARLRAYWTNPGPLTETPGSEEILKHLDPEVEWDWLLSPKVFRGLAQVLQAVADWIQTMDDWRVEAQELIDGQGDRVLAIVRVIARGKGSGIRVDQLSFTVIAVRNDKIARIEEHAERAEALEAAGLSE